MKLNILFWYIHIYVSMKFHEKMLITKKVIRKYRRGDFFYKPFSYEKIFKIELWQFNCCQPLNTVRRHCLSSLYIYILMQCRQSGPSRRGASTGRGSRRWRCRPRIYWFNIDQEKLGNRDLILSLDMKVVQTMMIIRGGGFGFGGDAKFDKYVRFVAISPSCLKL